MTQYTTEELIQYLYQETSEERTKEIAKVIEVDWSVRERFEALRDSMRELDTVKVSSPRPQSIMAILNYAKASAEVEHS